MGNTLYGWSHVEGMAHIHAWPQIGPPKSRLCISLHCSCVKKVHHFLPPGLTNKRVPLKACGLWHNGRIVNTTIRGQTGLGHLHRLRARMLLFSISWRTPFAALALLPIIAGYLGDLWLLCHFHTTGLIAPNSRGFWGNRWDRQSMLTTRCQPLAVI